MPPVLVNVNLVPPEFINLKISAPLVQFMSNPLEDCVKRVPQVVLDAPLSAEPKSPNAIEPSPFAPPFT
jgi:hypothetical protein